MSICDTVRSTLFSLFKDRRVSMDEDLSEGLVEQFKGLHRKTRIR